MEKYNGSKCLICGKVITEDDDVVVCPECGTPYHTDCYKKEGKCVNTALHEAHQSWVTDSPEQPHGFSDNVICHNCGFSNQPMSLFCNNCGSPLDTLREHNDAMREQNNSTNKFDEKSIPGGINIQPFVVNFSDPLCGYNPDEDFEGTRLCEIADYVGDNTFYYLPVFKNLKESGRAMSWNFSAMLFPELYFANRKMPLMAILCVLIRIVSQIPYYITTLAYYGVSIDNYFDIRSSAFSALEVMSYVLLYGAMFFCGTFANWIYYKHVLRNTARIKKNVPLAQLRDKLHRKGGTSAAWLTVFIIIYIIVFFFPSMAAVTLIGK